jgi:four helix bundle protein
VSVAANLAEGSARRSRREQARFYGIALASARELECLLVIAADLGWLAPGALAELEAAVNEVERMLMGLIAAVES